MSITVIQENAYAEHNKKIDESMLYDFLVKGDGDFPEPLSNRVDLRDYAKKLYNNAVIIAELRDNQIVGIFAGYINDEIKKEAYVTFVNVLNKYRRNGIAKKILLEFIEVVSTHDSDIQLNDMYSIYYGDTLLNITDMNGNSDIVLKKGQSVVIWNYRSDVSYTPPTEKNFRRQMRVPDSALLLKTECGVNWDGTSATFKIKSNSTG